MPELLDYVSSRELDRLADALIDLAYSIALERLASGQLDEQTNDDHPSD